MPYTNIPTTDEEKTSFKTMLHHLGEALKISGKHLAVQSMLKDLDEAPDFVSEALEYLNGLVEIAQKHGVDNNKMMLTLEYYMQLQYITNDCGPHQVIIEQTMLRFLVERSSLGQKLKRNAKSLVANAEATGSNYVTSDEIDAMDALRQSKPEGHA